jgi:hypothetical protein
MHGLYWIPFGIFGLTVAVFQPAQAAPSSFEPEISCELEGTCSLCLVRTAWLGPSKFQSGIFNKTSGVLP